MNTKTKLTILAVTVTILSLTAFSNFDTKNTRAVEASEFLILIQNTHSGLRLTCEKGCAWKELSFSSGSEKSQLVDQYGMTTSNRDKLPKDENLSNFLFNIKTTRTGISLEGKEGTSWTYLDFSCPDSKCNQYIDRNGMTTKE
jgi:hypothetical protein